MSRAEWKRNLETKSGLTVPEIIAYEKKNARLGQTYGKYGTLAKQYLEEHAPAKLWALAGDLPEYLHGIDRAADELFKTMYGKLSKAERYRKTGEYLKDLQIETEIRHLIEEEITSEIVYADGGTI